MPVKIKFQIILKAKFEWWQFKNILIFVLKIENIKYIEILKLSHDTIS